MASELEITGQRDPKTQAVWDWIDAGVPQERESELAAYVVENWPASRGVQYAWLEIHPMSYIGPLLASEAAKVAKVNEIKSEELLSCCLNFASDSEVIPILRSADPRFRNLVSSALEPRSNYVLLQFFGRKWRWSERFFGPGTDELLFGARGLIGPPGAIGGLVAVGIYQLFILKFLAFFGVWALVFFLVRALIQRDVAPAFVPRDFDEEGLDQEIVRWALRQAHAQRIPDSAAHRQWQAWKNSIPAEIKEVSVARSQREPLELYEELESAEPSARQSAWLELQEIAQIRETPFHWLILDSLGARPDLVARYIEKLKGLELGFSPAYFRERLLVCPWLDVAQRVVWGEFNGYQELVVEFRVDESAECVDVHDEPVCFGRNTQIMAVPPRCELSGSWAGVFADYELVEAAWQLELADALPLESLQLGMEALVAAGYIQCAPEPGLEDVAYLFRKPLPEIGQTLYLELELGIEPGRSFDRVISLVLSDGVHYLEPEVLSAPKQLGPSLLAVEIRRLSGTQKTRVPTAGSC